METLITIVVVSLVLFGLYTLNENRLSKQNVGIYYTTTGNYIAGYNDIEGGKNIILNVEMDCLEIKFENMSRLIPVKSIKSCMIKSEHELQKAISLGKILLFGVFSLGMASNKTVVNNFLLITYKNNNEETHILLQSKNLEELNNKINQILSRQYT